MPGSAAKQQSIPVHTGVSAGRESGKLNKTDILNHLGSWLIVVDAVSNSLFFSA